MRPESKLEILEAFRGIAAFWVVLLHAHQSVTAFLGPLPYAPLIANGALGVDFFFVLSGFIIAYSSQRLIGRGGGYLDYARARLIRIYVPYLPIGIALYILYLALPSVSGATRTPGFWTSFTLLPTNHPPALSVAWTLVHEMIFYAIFSLAFVSRRLLLIALASWGLLIAGTAISGTNLDPFARYFLSPINLCFLGGALVFEISRRFPLPNAAAVASILFGAAAVLWAASHDSPNRILVAVGFMSIVAGAASPFGSRIRVWRWTAMIGAASYAIYLIQNPLLSLAVRVTREIAPGIHLWLVLPTLAGIGTLGGMMYWAMYERSALKLARNLWPASSGNRARQSAHPTRDKL